MNSITLHTNNINDVTIISNLFIDTYMPKANGSYVKVYLYLLRILSSSDMAITVSVIADSLEDSEKDIVRALNYWDKANVLTLEKDMQGNITGITMNNLSALTSNVDSEIAATNSNSQDYDTIESSDQELYYENEDIGFDKPTYSKSQVEDLTNSDEIKWLLNIIEIYLERLLKPTDIQLILFLYENVGFSVELIMYLYEYCVSKNKKNSSYIEAVAMKWAEAGLDTVEKAEASTIAYNSNYNAVSKAFGLNRTPGAVEQKYINKWVNTYGFNDDILVEACNRAILSTQKPDFKYADRILENWYKKGVHHLSDIEKLDAEHARASTQSNRPNVPAKNTTNKFNAFPQRTYTTQDYSSLEQRLLNK